MSSLSQSHQVVCVTHLPQIAVMADVHYRIEKRVEDNLPIRSYLCWMKMNVRRK